MGLCWPAGSEGPQCPEVVMLQSRWRTIRGSRKCHPENRSTEKEAVEASPWAGGPSRQPAGHGEVASS